MTYDTEPSGLETSAAQGSDAAPATPPTAATPEANRIKELESAARETLARLGAHPDAAAQPSAATHHKVSAFDIPVALADGSSLLLNARTRSLIHLSAKETKLYRQLATAASFPANQPPDRLLLQTLVRAGHVVGANVDEVDWVRRNYDSRRAKKDTLSLTIAPTMACNFGCGYCFQGSDKPTSKMSVEVEDSIFAFVAAKKDLKSLSIVWYGGEPLMGRDSIFRLSDRLIAYCDKNKIAYSAGIVSNSYLLTAEVAQQLYSRRVKWVQVTIDGDREAHDQMRPLTSGRGTFDPIIGNIGAVLDSTPLSFNVRINVGRTNIDSIGSLLDELAARNFAKRGSINVYFAPIEASTAESGRAFDERLARLDFSRRILDMEEKAKRLGLASSNAPPGDFSGMCVAAAQGGYVITAHGDVHKCWDTAHDTTKRIGSITEPATLDDNPAASLWREWTPFDNATCATCKVLPMCGGHCAQRFIYSGPEHNAMPCPPWKWNTAEYVFNRAVDLNIVPRTLWQPDQATALTQQSGQVHSRESLQSAQQAVLEKVSAKYGRKIDRAVLLAGDLVPVKTPTACDAKPCKP